MVLLNVIWLLCCLPVVTAGASTTALWIPLLAALAVAAANLWIGLHTDSGLGNLCRGVGAVLLLLWLLVGGAASAVAISGLLLPVQKEIGKQREEGEN